MGTRASFWVGNPSDLQKREWLGCVAWDGYPEGIEGLAAVKSESDFRELVKEQSKRKDFASPSGGWPYPWTDDIYLTDYTYAWFDGQMQLTAFHQGFMSLAEYEKESKSESEEERRDTLPGNVPAPAAYNPKQPDSIMIFTR